MYSNNINLRIKEGQIELIMVKPIINQFSLQEIGLKDTYIVEGGNLRLKIELGYVQEHNFYKMPIIQLDYEKNIHESEWVVEFNGENILEKKDHSGKSTVLLLNRNKLKKLVHRHENSLIIHGDFSEEVEIRSTSHFHIFEN